MGLSTERGYGMANEANRPCKNAPSRRLVADHRQRVAEKSKASVLPNDATEPTKLPIIKNPRPARMKIFC